MLSFLTRFGANASGLPAVLLPAPTSLPSLSAAFSRRAALFGAVASTGALAGSAGSAMGLGAGVAPALAADTADVALIVQADAFRALCAREYQAWDDLCDNDQDGETPALTACRVLSQCLRDAGETLAAMPARTPDGLAAKASAMLTLVGPRLDTQNALSEHEELVVSILRDAARLGGGARV